MLHSLRERQGESIMSRASSQGGSLAGAVSTAECAVTLSMQ